MVECIDNDFDNDVDIEIDDNNDIDNSNFDRTLIVGHCFCGQTYLMMSEILSSEGHISDRQIKISTRSTNQNPIYGTSDEILSINEYKDCVVILHDMLETKQKDIAPFFTRGTHEQIDVY